MKGSNTLNTPTKRAGAMILFMGLALLTYGVLALLFDSASAKEFSDKFFRTILLIDRWETENFWPVLYGFYAAILGLLFSYLYDPAIGRLVRWVVHGK